MEPNQSLFKEIVTYFGFDYLECGIVLDHPPRQQRDRYKLVTMFTSYSRLDLVCIRITEVDSH